MVHRERVLKIVLVAVGTMFVALAYPMTVFFTQDPALAMMLSVYAILGIFLLLAARDPAANRSLIAFTAWSSLAHAVIMGGQAYLKVVQRGELIGVGVLMLIAIALLALAPKRPRGDQNGKTTAN